MPRRRKRKSRFQKQMSQFRADRPLYLAVAAAMTLVWVMLNASMIVPP